MADNIISQYYTKNDGSQIGNDAQLINGVYQNEKIINKNSGEKFVKSSNYRNVFDKVDEKISKIDDANANGVCSCKNTSGVEVDTFKCHVPVSNSAPTLNWGQTSTIGSIDGKPLTVILPPNPNTDTKYSAGTGLTLSGTTFSISSNYLNGIEEQGSNFIRYTNGLQLCWYNGLVGFSEDEMNAGVSVKTHPYPRPFKDGSYALIGASFGIRGHGEQFISKYSSYLMIHYNINLSETRSFDYLAIGMWK